MRFVNTELFRTEALQFEKYGYYCGDPPGTSEFMKYWNEQAKRCINGYSVGGVKITGEHYFYLNFCRIKLTRENDGEKVTKKKIKSGDKRFYFPDFWDGDYEYFWTLDIAKNGITEEELKALDLEIVPIDLGGGNNVIVLKRRRAGFSYKNGSLGAHKYTFFRDSLTIIGAYESKYLFPSGTMTMATDYLNFIDENTAWAKRRLIDTRDHVKSGFKQVVNGVELIKGYKSAITALSFKDRVDSARGKDPNLVLFEECGTFANLKAAYAATLPSVQDGNVTTGLIVLFGCVCAGTKVWNNQGYPTNIEDLTQEEGILGYDFNSTYQEDITWMNPPSKKPCYTITTISGTTISCSEDHPILWSTGGNAYNKRETIDGKRVSLKCTKRSVFKEAKDIKVKDQIAIINSIPIFGDKEMWQPRLVGMLIGDGSYGIDKTPRLSNCDYEVNNYIDTNFDTVIEKEYLTKQNKKYRETRIRGICKNLRELGIYGQTKNRKTLPENIHQYDRNSLAELIAGLYDTDGYIGKKSIVLTSSSKTLIEEVKEILIKFGIHGNIYEVDVNKYGNTNKTIKDVNNYFRLITSDKLSVVNFYKNIPLLIEYKKESLKTIFESVNKDTFEIVYVERNEDNKRYVNTTDISGIRFETVKSVEFIGDQYVYNLTTGKTHTYLANNVITHNTGGLMQSGILDFESMFYDPETYSLLPFENIWDESATSSCGYFFPDYKNKVGFIDKNGNSDIENAKLYAEGLREQIKRTSRDPQAIDMHIVERPFNPKEGFMQINGNIFPVAELQKWRSKLLTDKNLLNVGVAGRIVHSEGGLKFRPDNSLKPITEFPPKKDTDLTGCIVQYQPPFRDGAGNIPTGLYIVVVDPYAHDKTTGVSIGAAYVIKRINNFSFPDDMIVASYVGRPMTQDMFNDNLFLLAQYYNAKIGFENDRGNIIDYARYHNKTKFLIEEIELIDKKENINFKKLGRNYGMSMGTKDRKGQAAIYLRDWLRTERGKNENGDPKLNLHLIYDIALIDELIKYNPDGNFDRCLSKGTQVLTTVGYKPIESINTGDSVLTQSGYYNSVTTTHENFYCGEMVSIEVLGDYRKLNCTSTHPIFIRRYDKKPSGRKWRELKSKLPQGNFIKASEIKKGDFVMIPKRKNLQKTEFSDEILYIMGWYLSDGYISKSQNSLKIFLQEDQKEIGEDLVKLLNKNFYKRDVTVKEYTDKRGYYFKEHTEKRGLKARIKHSKDSNMWVIEFSSKEIKDLLYKHCGTPNNKILSEELYNSTGLLYLLKGYFEGDGHCRSDVRSDGARRSSLELATIYSTLLFQIRQILIDHGIWNTIRYLPSKTPTSKSQVSINITNEDMLPITVGSKKFTQDITIGKYNRKAFHEDENGFYTPVKNVTHYYNEEYVYNLSVDVDESYVANSTLTHNCSSLLCGMYFLKDSYRKEIFVAMEENPDSLFNRALY